MLLNQIRQAFDNLSDRLAVAPRRPFEIALGDDGGSFADAARGNWITDDGAIRIELKADGRFDKRKEGHPGPHGGRYEVDRSRLYFETDTGLAVAGRLRRGRLEIGGKRFRKA